MLPLHNSEIEGRGDSTAKHDAAHDSAPSRPQRHQHRSKRSGPKHMSHSRSGRRRGDVEEHEGIEEGLGGLTEMIAPRPDENPDEHRMYRDERLEERRSSVEEEEEEEEEMREEQKEKGAEGEEREKEDGQRLRPSRRRLERVIVLGLTVSHLVLMSIVGCIARIALEHLTMYNDAITTTTVAWPNLAGSLVLGLLLQDRHLFAGYRSIAGRIARRRRHRPKTEQDGERAEEVDIVEEEVEKTTVPMYVGLAVGFCGSLTSFSTVMGDAYSAAANSLAAPVYHPPDLSLASSNLGWQTAARPGGNGVMALLAVLVINIAVAVGGFRVGAHLAIALERVIVAHGSKSHSKTNSKTNSNSDSNSNFQSKPQSTPGSARHVHLLLELVGAVLGWAAWAVCIAVFVRRRSDQPSALADRLVGAAALAPPGCVLRFALAMSLNRRVAAFPLGTFAANLLATAVLGALGDVHRLAGSDSAIFSSCRLPTAALDGFCGALSTVSTWVAEFSRLRKRHAYVYVLSTVLGGLALLALMQGLVDGLIGWRSNACR